MESPSENSNEMKITFSLIISGMVQIDLIENPIKKKGPFFHNKTKRLKNKRVSVQ